MIYNSSEKLHKVFKSAARLTRKRPDDTERKNDF